MASKQAHSPVTLTRDSISLRAMLSTDLEAVLKLERTVQVNPWSRLSFEQSLTQQHICRAVEHQNQIVAFHIVCAVADEMHILNLAVAARHQGKGLGHVLLDDIIQQAKQAKLEKLFLEVRESNKAAQSLYQKWQFEQIAVRKNYYSATQEQDRENALVMLRKVNP